MREIENPLEPWRIPLEERFSTLEKAKAQGKKIALYFSKAADDSTFRYRCYNTYQATLKSKKWQSVFFYHPEFNVIREQAKKADLLILGRQSRWESAIESFVEFARKNNQPVFFDLDDLVFDKKYLYTFANSISGLSSLSYWSPYFSDINKTARHADGFITTNDFIGKKLQSNFVKPYAVIRNSLNDEQVSASRVYLKHKQKPKKYDKFTMGFFGGSPTHRNDLESVLPELIYFLETHENARFSIVGHMQIDKTVEPFLKNGQVTFTTYVDFRKLQRLMSEVDVNLAPLVINDFTNCKSELKFFEAAIVETTTIASPTFCFKQAIENGKTGFLCNQGEWYDTIDYLYNNPEINQSVASLAKEYCLKNYYGKHFLNEVEKAYDQCSR